MERDQIFRLFLTSDKLKFSEIEKHLKIRSNMVSYHLERMVKDKILEKKGMHYVLTKDAERFIPYTSSPSPLPVVLVAIMRKNKVMLINRIKRPYKGYWGLIGGRLLLGESIEEATIRLAKEKAGAHIKNVMICGMMHENVIEAGIVKHSFLLILARTQVTSCKKAKWFSINTIAKLKIIPSDLYMIETMDKSILDIRRCVLEEEDGEINGFRLVDSNIFK